MPLWRPPRDKLLSRFVHGDLLFFDVKSQWTDTHVVFTTHQFTNIWAVSTLAIMNNAGICWLLMSKFLCRHACDFLEVN